MKMELEIEYLPANEASAREILQWKYEPPYEVYNYRPESFEEDLAYHLDPSNNIYSIYKNDALIGYCSFGQDGRVPGGDYSEEALDIGLMIKPELTGQGLGSGIVEDVIEFAGKQFNPKRLRVTILADNLRAQRVWERNGFQKVQEFRRARDRLPFVILTREA